MRYAIANGESIKELATRLFRLPDKTAKTAKQAAEVLLAANPQLRDMSKIPAGTVISIPDDSPPLKPSEEAPASDLRKVAITHEAQRALYVLNQRLREIDRKAAERTTGFLVLTKTDQVTSFLKSAPDVKEPLGHMIASMEAATQAVDVEIKARDELVAEFQTKLRTPSAR